MVNEKTETYLGKFEFRRGRENQAIYFESQKFKPTITPIFTIRQPHTFYSIAVQIHYNQHLFLFCKNGDNLPAPLTTLSFDQEIQITFRKRHTLCLYIRILEPKAMSCHFYI